MTTIDVIAHNAQAWDNHVKNASQWTVPVEHEEIEAARAGLFSRYSLNTGIKHPAMALANTASKKTRGMRLAVKKALASMPTL